MEVESTSPVDPGREEPEPDQHPESASKRQAPHDAFFKQTFSDARLAGIFLRERLPEYWANMFASVNPVLCEAEFIKNDLTKLFADRVFGLPPIVHAEGRLYFILEGKVWAAWLDVMQMSEYCFAILQNWHRQVVNRARKDLEERQAPEMVAVLVHSGPYKYGYATKLEELQGVAEKVPHDRPRSAVSVEFVLVDLRTIEDEQLSKDPILCARLRALRYGGDQKLEHHCQAGP